MKIRHGIIIFIVLTIGLTILDEPSIPIDFAIKHLLTNIFLIFWFVSLGLIAYLIIRNIFRAIRRAVTGTPKAGDYRGEAQKACESVTPKRSRDEKPPWEE